MHRRMGGLNEFEFLRINNVVGLNVTIGISGWLGDREDVYRPFEALLDTGEQYVLSFESVQLQSLGRFLNELLTSQVISYASIGVLKQTLLANLTAALIWPVALLSLSSIIDNRWSVLLDRSEQAGKLLASVLIHHFQGSRPIILIGYSLGSRVIYFCLRELYRKKAFGIVHEAYLLGTPAPASTCFWNEMGCVVSGRLVNGYARDDWILGFLLRSWIAQTPLAGLNAIDSPFVENIDLSEHIENHLDYRKRMPWLLSLLGLMIDERSLLPPSITE